MVESILIILIVIFAPRLIVLLSDRYKFFGTLGPVFLCYVVGFIFSFIFKDTSMATTLSEVCIPIAIPLILFSANLGTLKKLAKPALISFILVIVSVSVISFVSCLIFRNSVDDCERINAMLIGLYTGGTPNLMAIGLALGVSDQNILLANTADLIAGGIYFAIIISFLPKVLRKILPSFSKEHHSTDAVLEDELAENFNKTKTVFSFRSILRKIPAVLIAAGCVVVSLGASYLITGSATNITVVMLGVTLLGTAFSFVKKVRILPDSYNTGQYFIYMFSVAIGMSFDLSMIDGKTVMLLVMLLFVQFGSVILHVLLAKIFRIDADTTLITSTAGIYGPAFIPPVAGVLKNKDIILTGLICGILGYAVGNYLGLGMHLIFRLL